MTSWRILARPKSGGSGRVSSRFSPKVRPVRIDRAAAQDPLRGEEVERAKHVVVAPHPPRGTGREVGADRQVGVGGERVLVHGTELRADAPQPAR